MPVQTISTPKLKIYSECPKQFEYRLSKGFPQEVIGAQTQILKNIICNAYLKSARTGKESPWRQVTREIDRWIFKDSPDRTHPEYDLIVDQSVKKSLKLIRQVKKQWYDPHYINSGYEGFPFLNVGLNINNTIVYDTIDLVLFSGNELIVCGFSDVESNVSLMYNSIRIRAQALLLSKDLRRPVKKFRFFSWPEGKDIQITDMFIHKQTEFMNKTEAALRHIVSGINQKVFYPSVNAQCVTCPFNTICSF